MKEFDENNFNEELDKLLTYITSLEHKTIELESKAIKTFIDSQDELQVTQLKKELEEYIEELQSKIDTETKLFIENQSENYLANDVITLKEAFKQGLIISKPVIDSAIVSDTVKLQQEFYKEVLKQIKFNGNATIDEIYNRFSSKLFDGSQTSINKLSLELSAYIRKAGLKIKTEDRFIHDIYAYSKLQMRKVTKEAYQLLQDKIVEDSGLPEEDIYYEVSGHRGARPSHHKWQAQVYSKKDFIRVCTQNEEAADNIYKFSCRHRHYLFIPKISQPTFNKDDFPEDDNDTDYKNSQIKRKYERDIRAIKRDMIPSEVLNSDDLLKYKNKLKAKSKEYNAFLKETGLTRSRQNEGVEAKDVD